MNISPFTPMSKTQLVEIVRAVRGTVGDSARRSRDFYLGMCEALDRDLTIAAAKKLGYLRGKEEEETN